MPEYLKEENGKIRKIKHHFCNSKGEQNPYGCQLIIDKKIEDALWNYFPYRTLIPASESEYNEYISQPQNK